MSVASRRLPIRWLMDLLIVGAVLAGGAWLGVRYLAWNQPQTMAEWELGPAVMMACGHGFRQPDASSPALAAFLLRERPAMTCTDLGDGGGVAPPPVAQGERYVIGLASMALRVWGLSWGAMDAYLGALFGVAMALAYGIFRLIAGPALATAGVVALAWSNQLPMLISLRDYGKQPVFYAVALALAWLAWRGRDGAGRPLYLPAAVAGVLVGLGLGFRVDVIIFVPAVLGVIGLVTSGWDRPALVAKAGAGATFLVVLVAAGAPVLASMSRGSNSAHVVVLGLIQPFDRTLGLESAPYDVGHAYTDLYAHTLIAAHADLAQGVATPIVYGSAEYDRAGGRLLGDLARKFPADVVTRTLGATAQVLRYPFDGYARGSHRSVAPFNESYVYGKIGEWRDRLLAPIEGREIALAVLVLFVVACRDWRLGVAGALLTLYFCGYSMLQFSRRHTFHLDLVPLGFTVLAAHLAVGMGAAAFVRVRAGGWAALGRVASPGVRTGLAATGVLALALLVVVSGTRWWQQRQVVTLVERTLAGEWQAWPAEAAVETEIDTAEAGAAVWRLARPARQAPRVQAEYLRVDLDGSCGAQAVDLRLAYAGVDDLTRTLRVPVMPDAGYAHALTPVFYQDGPDWMHFDRVVVERAQAGCVREIRRAAHPHAVPLPVLALALAPGWRTQAWHQRLQLPPAFTATGTPSHRTSPPEGETAW